MIPDGGSRSTEPPKPPLRVALLVGEMEQPAWMRQIIQEIEASEYAKIVLVVERDHAAASGARNTAQNTAPGTAPNPGQNTAQGAARNAVQRIWAQRNELLYLLYLKLDHRLFRSSPDPFVRADIRPLLPGCPVIGLDAAAGVEPSRIHDYALDVALCFDCLPLRDRDLEMAKHGVWSLILSDEQVGPGGPPGFWEMAEGRDTISSGLARLNGDAGPAAVLYRSTAHTDPRSLRRTRSGCCWKTAEFIPRMLRRLWLEGPDALTPAPRDAGTGRHEPGLRAPDPDQRAPRRPTNRAAARALWRIGRRSLAERLENATTTRQWFIAYRLDGDNGSSSARSLETDLHPIDTAIQGFRFMLPPRDRAWADPFPWCMDGRYYLFLEEVPLPRGRGWISVCELAGNGNWTPPRRILEKDYHISYPFVFRWRGELYMLPESSENSTLELHRCTRFPDRWESAAVIFDRTRAVDATLHEKDGRWWMFVNLARPGASLNDELHLFSAASPLGPWSPHRRNPIKSDVRSARPAGRLLERDGQLFRPAQDCARRYGHAISIQRVERMDDAGYVEREVSRIEPDWHPGLLGTHTFNSERGLTVIDGRRRRWRLA